MSEGKSKNMDKQTLVALQRQEDIKKLERRVKHEEKKLAPKAGKLPETTEDAGD
jgi:ribosomal protein S17